jgi:hypothetical protein
MKNLNGVDLKKNYSNHERKNYKFLILFYQGSNLNFLSNLLIKNFISYLILTYRLMFKLDDAAQVPTVLIVGSTFSIPP